jgi:hypothetical protein
MQFFFSLFLIGSGPLPLFLSLFFFRCSRCSPAQPFFLFFLHCAAQFLQVAVLFSPRTAPLPRPRSPALRPFLLSPLSLADGWMPPVGPVPFPAIGSDSSPSSTAVWRRLACAPPRARTARPRGPPNLSAVP